MFEVGALFALFEFFLDASGYSAEKLRSETAPFSEKSLIRTLILHNYRKFEMCSAYMRCVYEMIHRGGSRVGVATPCFVEQGRQEADH